MRGTDSYNESLFSTVRLEEFVPQAHPLRAIRTWMNQALADMEAKFSAMYEADVVGGRPSIAPEKLMRAMLLQVLYSVRSERQIVEQISYNLLFRWFVGLSIEDNTCTTQANGTAERDAAALMLADVSLDKRRITVGADKGYDTWDFVKTCRKHGVTPHVARNVNRNGGSAIDARTTRHLGYAISQVKRKCIEQCFGWGKTIGPIRQVMMRGLDKVDTIFTLTMAAYNLTRMRTLAQLRPMGA